MLFIIAWRNIWRNKVRSFTIIGSVLVGLWAGIFILAFFRGMSLQQVNTSIAQQLSHIQVHHPLFKQNAELADSVAQYPALLQYLDKDPLVKAFSGRLLVTAMAASATASGGVTICGIDPDQEKEVTGLNHRIRTGKWLDDSTHNEILIGEKLRKKLQLNPGGKIILTFQDLTGNLTAGAFHIQGIYTSNNTTVEESLVYCLRSDLEMLTGTHNQVHEVAVLLKDDRQLETAAAGIRAATTGNLVETWKELSPELRIMIDSFYQYMYIMIGIILAALVFGIINTMLMAVLERYRELGVLMAVGLNRSKVFSMIMLETLMMTLVGCLTGLPLAWLSILFFGNRGIDLSGFAEGLAMYGYGNMVYPSLETMYYYQVGGMAMVASILAAVYPARKAVKLKPVEAIRKI